MDKISKFLLRLSKKDRIFLLSVFSDILILRLGNYDVKPLKGYKNVYRLKKGKVRIVFYKEQKKGIIIDIAFRKNIYKNL